MWILGASESGGVRAGVDLAAAPHAAALSALSSSGLLLAALPALAALGLASGPLCRRSGPLWPLWPLRSSLASLASLAALAALRYVPMTSSASTPSTQMSGKPMARIRS